MTIIITPYPEGFHVEARYEGLYFNWGAFKTFHEVLWMLLNTPWDYIVVVC